ncbi:hicB family protein [Yersinia ruckeri]|nr:hicB family protein [Yersinia ruckeri]
MSWLAPSRVQALDGITALVADVLAEMGRVGETPPVPLSEKQFSGKLVLRMPPDQHRRLAISAIEEGISLNRYLCSRLTC